MIQNVESKSERQMLAELFRFFREISKFAFWFNFSFPKLSLQDFSFSMVNDYSRYERTVITGKRFYEVIRKRITHFLGERSVKVKEKAMV